MIFHDADAYDEEIWKMIAGLGMKRDGTMGEETPHLFWYDEENQSECRRAETLSAVTVPLTRICLEALKSIPSIPYSRWFMEESTIQKIASVLADFEAEWEPGDIIWNEKKSLADVEQPENYGTGCHSASGAYRENERDMAAVREQIEKIAEAICERKRIRLTDGNFFAPIRLEYSLYENRWRVLGNRIIPIEKIEFPIVTGESFSEEDEARYLQEAEARRKKLTFSIRNSGAGRYSTFGMGDVLSFCNAFQREVRNEATKRGGGIWRVTIWVNPEDEETVRTQLRRLGSVDFITFEDEEKYSGLYRAAAFMREDI